MYRPRLAHLGLVLLLFAAGCWEGGLTTEPVHPGDALHAISDGSHDGIEGFYFLPPMVRNPDYAGTFDATLSPVVEICETTACVVLHETFSMTEGSGSELVRLDEVNEHYAVNWHTDRTGPDGLGTEVGQTYRVRVQVAGTVLGYADVQMAENGKEAKNTTTDDVIGLVDGRTLPIKFRVEEGTVFVVGSEGGTFTSNDGAVTIEVPQGAVVGDIGIIVTPVTDVPHDPDVVPGLAFAFLPSPYTFAEPVILTVVYDPLSLPTGISEDELRLLAFDGEEWVQLPGSSVDLTTSTVSGPLESFSRKAVGRGKVHAISVTPEGASIDVGETQQFVATVTNVDGEVMSRNVQWSSLEEGVATIDNTGLATGVALGEATIEARSGKVGGSAALTVETPGPVVYRIEVSPAAATIDVGATQQFTATVYDQNHNVMMEDETVTWSSGDAGIASVNEAGLATGVSVGETTIIATSGSVIGNANLGVAAADVSSPFVTKWDTNLSWGTRIALALAGTVDATIDWGDGTSKEAVIGPGPHYHTYATEGIYTVSVTGRVTGYNSWINGGGSSERSKLVEVVAWGDVGFMSLSYAFRFSNNLLAVPESSEGLERVIDMSYMFYGVNNAFQNDIGGWNTGNVEDMTFMFSSSGFNQDIGSWDTGNVTSMQGMFLANDFFRQDIGGWDTGNVTDMSSMFRSTRFNRNIGGWNTSNVTTMERMFENSDFNQDIGGWDTGNVTDMSAMFRRAEFFNGAIGGWNTRNVTDMSFMFTQATSFNGDIGGWDTGSVTTMANMFSNARSFNGDIGGWNTENVTNMRYMFGFAERFNQNLGSWDTGNVTDMVYMFRNATAFNGDISGWNTGNVTTMTAMFLFASSFNGDIGGWDTRNVRAMSSVFRGATAFNGDIGHWNTGNVTDMFGMFAQATSFNGDIGGWDTGSVTTMSNMFSGATSFNQDIGNWNTENVTGMFGTFEDAKSFNRDLSGWCVTSITSMPSRFDTGATSWVLPRPVWGTCPE